jgi:hypothetical protein
LIEPSMITPALPTPKRLQTKAQLPQLDSCIAPRFWFYRSWRHPHRGDRHLQWRVLPSRSVRQSHARSAPSKINPTRHAATEKWSGTGEFSPKNAFYAHAWTSQHGRAIALSTWNIRYNYHRPHSAADDQPPASRRADGITNSWPHTASHHMYSPRPALGCQIPHTFV